MHKNQNGFGALAWIIGMVVLVAATAFTFWRITQADKTVSDAEQASVENTVVETPENKTSLADIDAIKVFNEVTAQLNVDGPKVKFFYIYGEDRVTFNRDKDTVYAYKRLGQWEIAYIGSFPPECTVLDNVPIDYRPACFVPGDRSHQDDVVYQDDNGDQVNYPESQRIIFREP